MATYEESDASATSEDVDETEMGKRSADLRADVVFLVNKRPKLSDSPDRKDGEHLKSTGPGEEESKNQASGKKTASEDGLKEDGSVDQQTQEKSPGLKREDSNGSEGGVEVTERDDGKPTAGSDGSVAKKVNIAFEDDFEKTHHTFPERLMELLESEEVKNAMWWLPGGDAFTIVPRLFPEMVLNKFFQGTKFESFTRKLNRWGFKRVAGQRVPQNTIAYHHPMFQQGSPELVKNMRSGRKREQDGQAMLSTQLDRDLQAAGLSTVAVTNPYMGGLAIPIATLPSGLVGQNVIQVDPSTLHPQFLQQAANPLGQAPGWSLLASHQPAQAADLAAQRQAQLLAAERARLEQQQQELEASELLRKQLFGGSAFGGSPVLNRQPEAATSYVPVTVSLQQLLQQPGLQPTVVALPPAPSAASQGEHQRLLRLLLEQQRQQSWPQDRNSSF